MATSTQRGSGPANVNSSQSGGPPPQQQPSFLQRATGYLSSLKGHKDTASVSTACDLPEATPAGGNTKKILARVLNNDLPMNQKAAHNTDLELIARASYDSRERKVILAELQSGLAEQSVKKWRRVYNSLVLLGCVVQEGSSRIIAESQDGLHVDMLQKLMFLCVFDHPSDKRVTSLVREKAAEVRNLVLNKCSQIDEEGDSDQSNSDYPAAKAPKKKKTTTRKGRSSSESSSSSGGSSSAPRQSPKTRLIDTEAAAAASAKAPSQPSPPALGDSRVLGMTKKISPTTATRSAPSSAYSTLVRIGHRDDSTSEEEEEKAKEHTIGIAKKKQKNSVPTQLKAHTSAPVAPTQPTLKTRPRSKTDTQSPAMGAASSSSDSSSSSSDDSSSDSGSDASSVDVPLARPAAKTLPESTAVTSGTNLLDL